MKATSIEQIRSHIERGGRVLSVNKAGHGRAVTRVDRQIVFVESEAWCTFDSIEIDHWELLPIEEKWMPMYATEDAIVCGGKVVKAESEGHAGDCTIYASKSNGEPTDGICTCGYELRMQRGSEPKPIEEEENLPLHCDYEAEHHAMQWRSRIRTALLYGRRPEMSDLLEWWQATTGEKIEHGERCKACECSGVFSVYGKEVHCIMCNGSGYTVRPTWMEEQARDG